MLGYKIHFKFELPATSISTLLLWQGCKFFATVKFMTNNSRAQYSMCMCSVCFRLWKGCDKTYRIEGHQLVDAKQKCRDRHSVKINILFGLLINVNYFCIREMFTAIDVITILLISLLKLKFSILYRVKCRNTGFI